MTDFGPRLSAFARLLRESIPTVEGDKVSRSRIDEASLPNVLIHYLNYASRLVAPRPRTVHYFSGFWNDQRIGDDMPNILSLERSISSGIDVNHRLSPKIKDHGFIHGKHRWDDKDFILNAYGIHHLHLRAGRKPGDSLVFIGFRRHEAFFIKYGNHRSFHDGSLDDLATLWRLALGWELKGVELGESNFTPQERIKLALRGVNMMTEMDGKVVAQTGLSSSGHDLQTIRLADRMLDIIANVDPKLDSREYLKDLSDDTAVHIPANPVFEWVMDFQDLCILERSAGILWRMALGPI